MAILVSNPSTVQFTGAPNEPQDSAATLMDTGFTEELANAMLPAGQAADGQNSSTTPIAPGVDPKLNDLQILPPDVLLNAVGEANFALPAQGQQAPVGEALLKDSVPDLTENLVPESTDNTQAAEMAAAALAAQMSAQTVVVPPVASTSPLNASNDTLSIDQVATTISSVGVGSSPKAVPTEVSLQIAPTTLNEGSSSNSVQPQLSSDLKPNQDANLAAAQDQLMPGRTVVADPSIQASLVGTATTVIEVVQAPSDVVNADTQALNSMTGEQRQVDLQLAKQTSLSLNNELSGPDTLRAQANLSTADLAKQTDHFPQFQVDAASVDQANLEQTNTGLLDLQKSSFDLAQSDVARPGAEASANPDQGTFQAGTGIVGESAKKEFNVSSTTTLNVFQSEPQAVAAQFNKDDSAGDLQETSFKFDAKLGAPLSEAAILSKAVTNVPAPHQVAELQKAANIGEQVIPASMSNSTSPVESVTPAENQKFQTGSQVGAVATAILAPSGVPEVNQKTTSSATPDQVGKATEVLTVNPSITSEIDKNLSDALLADASEESSREQSNLQTGPVETVTTRLTQKSTSDSNSGETDSVNSLVAIGANAQSVVTDQTTFAAERDDVQASVKSFSDVSSTFVNTLVGGPQRPVTTVMDWVALKPQEPPRPVMPHELRLDAGAVQVEIQRMVKQGGGHVVMELTPPDQSKFTIELKLDEKGGAYLKVEGISDSTKTRLEQSAPQLQEQFQQMGLNLQLDMRQNRDSSQTDASNWTTSEPKFDNSPNQEATPQNTRAVAAERARKNNGGQVYLYA